MTLSRADEIRQRAREIEDHAYTVRHTQPYEAHRLNAIAGELGEIADHLPPDPRPSHPQE